MTESFDGATFDPDLDGKRLARQKELVFALMRDGVYQVDFV